MIKYNEWTKTVGYRRDTYNLYLEKGTYYIQINGYRYSEYEKSTGKYVFSLKELNQSNCQHEYQETTIEPTYFKKGYVLHQCKKCKKLYKDNYSEKKKLEKGYISIYSSTGKGKIYLQWSTVQGASGYQIRYCRKQTMKKGVKYKNITGQAKSKMIINKLHRMKNYYVQIRAYKKSETDVVYGAWSDKKLLRTN